MGKRIIKSEILETARQLFEERGYNAVTMRDIADTVGISLGNLTYHYKRKELLMEAAIIDLRQAYKIPLTPTTLVELNKVFTYMAKYNVDNIFYFRHYTQIAQISPRIHQNQVDMVRDHVYMFKSAFSEFQRNGLMRHELYMGQMTFLAYSIMNTTSFWFHQREVIQEAKSNPINEILCCVWSIISPMLTDKGMDIFIHKIVPVNMRLL